jgi:hypothetical protein
MLVLHRSILLWAACALLQGCLFRNERDDGGAVSVPSYGGLVSIQDVSIAGLPQAGHGLTVIAAFTPSHAPDFDEQPGTPYGCKASFYDLTKEPPPAETDQGRLHIAGLNGGDLRCAFQPGRGYVCPTARGQGAVTVAPAGNGARYALEDVQLSAANVGRYLQISGAASAENDGAFAILESVGGAIVVANPRAREETFDAEYAIVAGAGPTPGDRYEPYSEPAAVSVRLEPGERSAFEAFDVSITPGESFELDAESEQRIDHIEPDAESLTLGCDACGPATASVLRLNTTDADVSGLGPTAMPPAQRSSVEITCAVPDSESIRVPPAALAYLRESHARAPITRIRTAFMREGLAQAGPAGARVNVLVGHGVLGFSAPSRER